MTTTAKTPRQSRKQSKREKRDQMVQNLGQLQLLGEIVSWSLVENHGRKNTYTQVAQALKQVGLDEKLVKEFGATQAFNRACTKLKEERVIDIVREDSNEIQFQFSKKQELDDTSEGGKELAYRKEVKILLNRTTGQLTCKDPKVLAEAQEQLDRCREERTTSDISNMVTKLFEDNSDLIRMGVGVYFVPHEHTAFTDKIAYFLQLLDRKLLRFPVPAGTQSGDQSVQDAMASHFGRLLEKLDKEVEKFSVATRDGTVQGVAKEINTCRTKIEAYATYLQDKREELLQAVEDANARLVAKIEEVTEERKNLPPGQEGRDQYDCQLGSQASIINAALTTTFQTPPEIAQRCGLSVSRVSAHLKHWSKRDTGLGKVLRESNGKYAIATNEN